MRVAHGSHLYGKGARIGRLSSPPPFAFPRVRIQLREHVWTGNDAPPASRGLTESVRAHSGGRSHTSYLDIDVEYK